MIKTDYDVKKALSKLVEEWEITQEQEKIKERERKTKIREKAEREIPLPP